MMINVTKTFLPPFEEYSATLKRAWDKAWITNNGELVQELEAKLKAYLGVKHLFFTNNGTIVLQMAMKALNITKEVITTPFSYVATTNAILWEHCKPVFVDISNKDFCIDANMIEAAITKDTQAIMATHVFGLPCNVEKIEAIAKAHGIKVIYDGAHAFGTVYNGRQLLSYGDVATCSFHATKLFHTVEGGCIICHDDELANKLLLYRQFGHIGDDYYSMGINGKNSEFHAAMGICNLKHIHSIMETRKRQWLHYKKCFAATDLQVVTGEDSFDYNYSYFPIVLSSEAKLQAVFARLKEDNIIARRYFYPALNTLPFVEQQACPVAESIAARVLCLPVFHDLSPADQDRIIQIVVTETGKR
jgi:dTDP-4-amino-4,6-dideoxygalactose transaminase